MRYVDGLVCAFGNQHLCFQSSLTVSDWASWVQAIGSIAAIAGALGVMVLQQHLQERHRQRELHAGEIRDCNAATVIAATICNSGLNLKKQHIKGLWDSFGEQRAKLLQAEELRRQGHAPPQQRFVANLSRIPRFFAQTERLKTLLFEKLSVSGRPLAAADELSQAVERLNECLVVHQQLVDRFASMKGDQQAFLLLYFGLPDGNGVTDESYPSTLEGIVRATDSIIFFGQLVCRDLQVHAGALAAEIERNGRPAPRTTKANFDEARQLGLVPTDDSYKDWLIGFEKADSSGSTKQDA